MSSKMKIKNKNLNPSEGQPKVETLKTKDQEKVSAQEFVNYIMQIVGNRIENAMLPIRREIEDLKLENKRLRMRVKDTELEFQSLGMAIGELGIAEINILNDTKNLIRNKIGIIDLKGNIRGRNVVRRYNLIPSSENLLIQRRDE